MTTVWAVYFSGTGTTERTVTHIAGELARLLAAPCRSLDFTRPQVRQQELNFCQSDLVVLGTPVYAGRVPNVLLPFLREKVRGGGALAVPVVLFGNRNYDDALMELRDILQQDGFRCVAAGAFVGEHSFSRTLGAGRPDDGDMAGQSAFAREICEKLAGQAGTEMAPGPGPGRNAHPPLLHPPGPPRKPHQHPEGEAENGPGQVRRLRPVRGAVSHGLHRPGGRVPGQGHLHQVLRLRQKMPLRGQVL